MATPTNKTSIFCFHKMQEYRSQSNHSLYFFSRSQLSPEATSYTIHYKSVTSECKQAWRHRIRLNTSQLEPSPDTIQDITQYPIITHRPILESLHGTGCGKVWMNYLFMLLLLTGYDQGSYVWLAYRGLILDVDLIWYRFY